MVNNKVYWSDEKYRLLGLGTQDSAPEPATFLQYIHPDDIDFVQEKLQESLERKPCFFEYRYLAADGRTGWFSSVLK